MLRTPVAGLIDVRGLKPVVAVELEFYLFDQRMDDAGRPRTSINPATGQRNTLSLIHI